ncbi:hypothetical protein TIFTF001_025629 [Ficus carica]|uniref:Copper transport protein n=1 Tax=Ficus carica TaxID=3494 RepID=A0AA88APD6_FICCA|nr:hypothetical protein TIFTF001_025629 [Ficus carica]
MSLHEHQHQYNNMNMDMDMDMDMNKNKTMNMEMRFRWGKNAIILFAGWPGQSLPMYLLALVFVFLMAVAVELLSLPAAVDKAAATIPTLAAYSRACVYTLRIGLAYLVMLSIMSFNVGIFIAAVAGHAVGFFMAKVDGAVRQSDQEEYESPA